jgi:hypothetical protein
MSPVVVRARIVEMRGPCSTGKVVVVVTLSQSLKMKRGQVPESTSWTFEGGFERPLQRSATATSSDVISDGVRNWVTVVQPKKRQKTRFITTWKQDIDRCKSSRYCARFLARCLAHCETRNRDNMRHSDVMPTTRHEIKILPGSAAFVPRIDAKFLSQAQRDRNDAPLPFPSCPVPAFDKGSSAGEDHMHPKTQPQDDESWIQRHGGAPCSWSRSKCPDSGVGTASSSRSRC